MAKKNIQPMHTKDVITWDTRTEDDTVEKHSERLAQYRDKQFEENNKQIYADMLATYEEFSDKFAKGSDDDQIRLLSRFHQVKDFTGWMIGDFLIRIENDIIDKKKSGYNSLRDFLEKNEHLLGFGKSAGFNYVNARRGVTIEQFKRLGIRKAVIVASISDPVEREKIIDKIESKPKTTEDDLKLMIAAYRETIQVGKQAEKVKTQKAVNKMAACDILEKKDSIVIKPHDPEMVGYFYEAIRRYESQIKAEAKRLAESDE